jgi:hypothetical protein
MRIMRDYCMTASIFCLSVRMFLHASIIDETILNMFVMKVLLQLLP